MSDSLGEDIFIKVEFFLYVLILVGLSKIWQEVTFHESLVLGCDFFGSDSEDTVGIVANSNEQGTEEDAHIEAVTFLPPGYVGRTGNNSGKLIRRI